MRMFLQLKIYILLVALMLHYLTGHAQYFNISNTGENLHLINSSSIGNNENITFYGYYRNQWPGTTDFISYSAAVLFNPDNYKSSYGVNAFRDVQGNGIINHTKLNLLYSYRITVNRYLSVTAGLQFSYSLYATNFQQLNFENNITPINLTNTRNSFYHFSTGIEVNYNKNTRYGISVTDPVLIQSNGQDYISPGIHAFYRTRIETLPLLSGKTYLEPLFYGAYYGNNTFFQYGSRIDANSFLTGIYFRQDIQFHFDAIIILLGTRFGNSSLFYSYDINLSNTGSNFTRLSAHEVTFLQNLEYKRKSSRKGAIKCPKF